MLGKACIRFSGQSHPNKLWSYCILEGNCSSPPKHLYQEQPVAIFCLGVSSKALPSLWRRRSSEYPSGKKVSPKQKRRQPPSLLDLLGFINGSLQSTWNYFTGGKSQGESWRFIATFSIGLSCCWYPTNFQTETNQLWRFGTRRFGTCFQRLGMIRNMPTSLGDSCEAFTGWKPQKYLAKQAT